jgi:hypothetical protein
MFKVNQLVKFYDVDSDSYLVGKICEILPKVVIVKFYENEVKKRFVWLNDYPNPLLEVLPGDKFVGTRSGTKATVTEVGEHMIHYKLGKSPFQASVCTFYQSFRPV